MSIGNKLSSSTIWLLVLNTSSSPPSLALVTSDRFAHYISLEIEANSVLVSCWANVVDGGLPINQHRSTSWFVCFLSENMRDINCGIELKCHLCQCILFTLIVLRLHGFFLKCSVSGGQCYTIHLTIPRRFSRPSLAYMCTNVAWNPIHFTSFHFVPLIYSSVILLSGKRH